MKVLVLGSAGQIGAPLVKHLKSNGHTVYEMDIVNDPHWQDLTIKNNVYLLEKIICTIHCTIHIIVKRFD